MRFGEPEWNEFEMGYPRDSDLAKRTKGIGLSAILLTRGWMSDPVLSILGRQLVRAATSVGANHRSALRSRSDRDLIAKLKICEEEADEVLFWLEMATESGLVPAELIDALYTEADEVLRMIVAGIAKVRARLPIVREEACEYGVDDSIGANQARMREFLVQGDR